MNDIVARHSAYGEKLCQFMAELSLISHTSGLSYEGKASLDAGEDIGGRRPPGGDRENTHGLSPDEFASWLQSYHRRTVDYFRVELERCETVLRLRELRDECVETLEAWRHTPIPEGQPPEFGSPQWKRWVAGVSRWMVASLARLFNCKRQYIHQIRKTYRRTSLSLLRFAAFTLQHDGGAQAVHKPGFDLTEEHCVIVGR